MTHSQPETTKSEISRRNFLGLSFLGAFGVLIAQTLGATLKFLQPVAKEGFGGEVFAGRVEEFAIGSVNRILSGRFFLVRTEDGLLALWQKCTHLGCSIPWDEDKQQFHCPCHGSVFNEVGEVTGGPAPRPMDLFPITIRSGEIWVDTGNPTQRSRFEADQVTDA
ncbi:MAG: Rieske (2Fe-2S) protein [Chloroflexi bacterium]|nr:MAG: Rieske (2Fe-2S) protein [Chloroflexota bacterium]MBL1195434.1 Rieske (2Fe-2S) protein [Chloroflexota bacterium]NOH12717.1 Rieske 2Fe-2S domain-containing protein [Chloroflexota bacterium]